jgi:ubiquinone/menaquinone biosynthesis C-methylase UbiE
LEAEIIRCDMKALPCISSSFDAVICVQTIYHQTLSEIRETISEIYRILKREGLLLANFHSKRSSKSGRGIEVEDGTFRQEDGPERGILHHFFDETELRELLRDFEVSLEAKEERIGDYLRSCFMVLAERI